MSSSIILHELVASHGDIRLAAERAHMSVSDMTTALINDPAALNEAVKSSIALQLLDLFSNLRVAIIASLGEMTPKEMSNLLGQILGGYSELTSDGVVNNNLINFPVQNDSVSATRDRLQGRLAQLATAAEGE